MAQDVATNPVFNINRIYMKGASLEMPKGAATFNITEPLNAKIDLNISNVVLDSQFSEVTLRATVSCAASDNSIIYLLEQDYAGIFQISGFSESDYVAILNTTCPAILIPYLRATVHESMVKAGLPAVILPEINWAAGFEERKAQESVASLRAPDTLQ